MVSGFVFCVIVVKKIWQKAELSRENKTKVVCDTKTTRSKPPKKSLVLFQKNRVATLLATILTIDHCHSCEAIITLSSPLVGVAVELLPID
jgi:hypothetical protein